MAATMVPDAADRPDVLPSERLLANGMAIPGLRGDLRRIDNGRNALSVAGGVVLGGVDHRRCRLHRPVVELSDRFRLDGADVRPLRHPHARGGAQAPLHQQALERRRRQVGGGLSGLHPGAALPARALRPPQGRVRARRAGHGVLLAVSMHAPGPVPAPRPRCRGHQRLEELRPARQEHAAQAVPPDRPLHLRRPGRAVGGHVGRHRALVDLPAAVVPPLDDRVARASTACVPSPSTAAWNAARTGEQRRTTYASRG